MKKLIAILVVLVVVGLFGWMAYTPTLTLPHQGGGDSSSKPVIKIGATLPLTGDAAEAGQAVKAGLEMTLENLKKKNLKYDYVLIYEDNQMNGHKTATTTNKLIMVDNVHVIMTMWGLMSNVAANITKDKNILGLYCAYGERPTVGEYNFKALAQIRLQF